MFCFGTHCQRFFYCCIFVALFAPAKILAADTADPAPLAPKKAKSIRRLMKAPSLFKKDIDPRGSFFDYEVENLDEDESFVAQPVPQEKTMEEKLEEQIRYVSPDPKAERIVSPDQKTSVRVNPNAPAEAKGLIGALRLGDEALAGKYADALLDKQLDFFFEVRQITKHYGNALIRKNLLEKDKWIGAEQMLEMELARTRNDMGALVKPDHNTAMQRIQADPQGKAQILYFFSLSCSWCRHMAPDIERLWRVAEKDENITMSALTIGKAPQAWVDEYRRYSGLQVPIYDGEAIAKKFNIRFVPTIVIIAPSSNKAYKKTGQQSFARMYQFVRRVQGIPARLSPTIKTLIETPIGEREIALAKKQGKPIHTRARGRLKSKHRVQVEVERF